MKLTMNNVDLPRRRELFKKRTGRRIIERQEFLSDLHAALREKRGYAAGRIGNSEQFWMYYPILRGEAAGKTKTRVFERHLRFYGFSQAGIFPANTEFFLRYNDFFLEQVRQLDCLGLILDPVMTPAIAAHYRLDNRMIYYRDLAPDRSVPSREENCYLHFFADRKLLLVCPFAGLLQQRADRETFERVWAKTGKKWFGPSSVDALEFPYGFDPATHRRFATSLELSAHIESEIDRRDFDIALIAAAGLTIPLSAHVKRLGKVAVSFGGDLQILFGVLGRRWRDWPRWRRDYFNEWWIDMPARYRPVAADVCDGGAYW